MEDKGEFLVGELFKKARLRSKWLVLGRFIDRPWSLRQFEVYKSKRCLKYFEAGKQKGEINLRGLKAKNAPYLNDEEHQHAFVVYDATGLEVLTLSATTTELMQQWINVLNAVAVGKDPSSSLSSKSLKAPSSQLLDAKAPDLGSFFREFSLHSFTSGSESSEEATSTKPISFVQSNPDVNSSQVTDSLVIKDGGTSSKGISMYALRLIRDFVAARDPTLSVGDVNESLLRSILEPHNISLISLLAHPLLPDFFHESSDLESIFSSYQDKNSAMPLVVDTASIFVSYCWSYKFVDVVDAVESFIRDFITSTDEIDSFGVWIDFACENQFKTMLLSSDWFEVTYPQLIQSINHTLLLILRPEEDASVEGETSNSHDNGCAICAGAYDLPVFARTWVLWELVCSIAGNCRLSLVCPSQFEDENVLGACAWYQTLLSLVCSINIANSECSVYSDRQRILESITWRHSNSQLSLKGQNSAVVLAHASNELTTDLLNWLLYVIFNEIQAKFGSVLDRLYIYSQLVGHVQQNLGCPVVERLCIAALNDIKESLTLTPEIQLYKISFECQLMDALHGRSRRCAEVLTVSGQLALNIISSAQRANITDAVVTNTTVAMLAANRDDGLSTWLERACKVLPVDHNLSPSVSGNEFDVDQNSNYCVLLFAEGYSVQAKYILKKLKSLVESTLMISTKDQKDQAAFAVALGCLCNYAAVECCEGNFQIGKQTFKKLLGIVFGEPQANESDCIHLLSDLNMCASKVRSLPKENAGVYLCVLYNASLLVKAECSADQLLTLSYCIVLTSCVAYGVDSLFTQEQICAYAQLLFVAGSLSESEKFYRFSLAWYRGMHSQSDEAFISLLQCKSGLARVFREIRTTESLIESQKLYTDIIEKIESRRRSAHQKAMAAGGKRELEVLKNQAAYKNQSIFLGKSLLYLSLIKIQRSLYGEASQLLEKALALFESSLSTASSLLPSTSHLVLLCKELMNDVV